MMTSERDADGQFSPVGFRFTSLTRAPPLAHSVPRRSHARAEMHSYSVRVNNVLSFAVSVWMVLCAMATASGEFRHPRANEREAPGIDF